MSEPFVSPMLLASLSFQTDLRRFLQAGTEVISWINSVVEKSGSFDVTVDVLNEGKTLGFTAELISSVLRVGHFLYDHSRHEKLDPNAAIAELEQLAVGLGETVEESTLKAVLVLLAAKEGYDRQQAIDSARSRATARLQSFSLAVDARAVAEPGSGRFLGFVPVILGRVSLAEGLTEQRHLDFRTSAERLKEIRETIDRALNEVDLITSELEGKLLS